MTVAAVIPFTGMQKGVAALIGYNEHSRFTAAWRKWSLEI